MQLNCILICQLLACQGGLIVGSNVRGVDGHADSVVRDVRPADPNRGDWGWAARVQLAYTPPRTGARTTIEELVGVTDPKGWALRLRRGRRGVPGRDTPKLVSG
jgi:hypothetical protein